MSTDPPGPGARRLVGIDVARALALLGMVATHILAERGADGGLSVSHTIASGRASALFAVLAGVSLALMSGRETPVGGEPLSQVRRGLAVRAVLIAAVGLTLGMLGSGLAVILTYYGLLFLLALPFLGLRSRTLFWLGGIWVIAAPALSQIVRPFLPERGFASPAWGQLADPGRLLSELAFTGYYPVVPWVAYVLLGMGIGRLRLDRRSVQAVFVALGAGVALVATFVSRTLTARDDVRRALAGDLGVAPDQVSDQIAGGLFGVTPVEGSWAWLLVVAPHSATPFDLAQTAGTALAVIGLCLLVVGAMGDFGTRAASVFFGAGAMTLTLYSLHVALRTDELWPPDDGGTAYGLHVMVLLGIGAGYAAARSRGPLETVVSRAAQSVGPGRERQALRREV